MLSPPLSQDRTRGGALGPPRRDAGLPLSCTGIIVPIDAGVFGSFTNSTPFLNVAATLVPSAQLAPTEPRSTSRPPFPGRFIEPGRLKSSAYRCHPRTTRIREVVSAGEKVSGAAAPHGGAPSYRSGHALQMRYGTIMRPSAVRLFAAHTSSGPSCS